MKNKSKIIFNDISKIFNGINRNSDVIALKNLSFSVEANEIFVIIGPSGCGKTTILNLIAGFIKPTGGAVLFDGEPITKPGKERTIIFQEYALFPWYSVRNNIEFGLISKKLPFKERRLISNELLQLIKMEKFADLFPYQLSGGMKQRVALARALAVEPDVLLMDEPFGSLDAQTRGFLQLSLLNIWKARKATIIFVTHSIDEAIILGQKILVLSSQPGEQRDCVEINKPFPRDLVRDQGLLDVKQRISKILDEELNNYLKKTLE